MAFWGKKLTIYISRHLSKNRSKITAMNQAFQLLFLLLLLHRLTSISADSANPQVMNQYTACSDKLVAFSACLPYVALAPNNLTDSPPPQCCDEVSDDFGDGSSVCLCYFVLRPDIFGFPLNRSKLVSLAAACPTKNRPASNANFPLDTICSGQAALPPLHSISGPRNPTLPNLLGAEDSLPLPPLEPSGSSSTEEPNEDESPSQPSPSTVPSTAQRMYRLSWTWLCFPVYIFASS